MSHTAVIDAAPVTERAPARARGWSTSRIPFRTVVGVELRKMFDTRSGFWLMVGIAAAGVLATAAVIAFAPTAT